MTSIDRPTFLALTFGMAGASAASCNTGPGPAVAANVVEIPAQPPQAPASAAPAKTAKANTATVEESARPEPQTEDEDLEMAAGDDDSQACGWVDPSTVPRPAGSCNDDQGAAPSCSALPTCAGFPFPRLECEMYRRTFKPKVAQRAIDCLTKLGANKLCNDACNVYRCADRALKSACPDPSVDTACKAIMATCRAATLSECRQYLTGLGAAGRTKMITCMTNSCSAGLYSCAEGL